MHGEKFDRAYKFACVRNPREPRNGQMRLIRSSIKCPGAWNAGFYRDHVHQTDAGYQFMADEIVAAIAAAAAMPVPSVGPVAAVLFSCLLASVGLWRLRR